MKVLEQLAGASDDMISKTVPSLVKEEIDKILSAFSREMSEVSSDARALSGKNEEISSRLAYVANNIKGMRDRMEGFEKRLSGLESKQENESRPPARRGR
jgi:chromosome segregation ATPase